MKHRRQLGIISLAVGLIVLASIIRWQYTKIKQLEAQQLATIHYDENIVSSNLFDMVNNLDLAINNINDSDLEYTKQSLSEALNSAEKAEIGAMEYNRKLETIYKTPIKLFGFDIFPSFRSAIVSINQELSRGETVSPKQIKKLQDVRDDIQLLYDTFSKAIEQDDPKFVAQQLNEITKDIKSQSIRQVLGIMPTLASLNVTSSNEIQQSVAIETESNCFTTGETATWIIEVANNNAEPLTLSATPPFDVVILDQAGQIRERWSQSPTFPPNTGAVLNSGETRSYTWNWPVHERYGTAITVRADVPSIVNSEVAISVNAVTYVDASGAKQTIACADL